MPQKLKSYPDYKESGSPWLGDVPAHWEVHSFRSLIKARNERNRPELPLLSVARERGVFVRSLIESEDNHNIIPEDLSNYKVAHGGDLVINKMKAWQGSMGIAPCDGIVSPAYFVFDFRIKNRSFGQVMLRSKPYSSHLGQSSDGVRVGQWDLSIAGMRQIPIVIPTENEQAAIVRFLDHAGRRVKSYIRSKQKLIKLLEEKREAIIHRAVTKGLDSNTRLKPSGIAWLGDVPAHWEFRRLRFLASIKTGGRDTAHRRDGGAYPFFVRSQTVERIDTFSYDGEAVLTAGDGAGVAKVFHYINGKFDYHQRVYKFSDFRGIRGKFFFYYFSNTLRYEAFRSTAKSTVDSLRLPMLQNFPVPVFSVEEQDAIVAELENSLVGLERTKKGIAQEISLLREYHSRLVADVVTGKLDVREIVATIPEEPREQLVVDEVGISGDDGSEIGESLDSAETEEGHE